MTEPTVHVFPTASEVIGAVADAFARLARECAAERGRFVVALAGGTTPKALYQALGERDDIPWRLMHVFFGDERNVPADHADSNYRLVRETLLQSAPIPRENVHPFPAQAEPERAAVEYEALMRTFFSDNAPGFDLILLGLGEDGHTASLFPGSPALDETAAWALAVNVPTLRSYRLTLSPVAINRAWEVWFLVTGSSKAAAVDASLSKTRDAARWPAQLVDPLSGRVVWWLDGAAAAKLEERD